MPISITANSAATIAQRNLLESSRNVTESTNRLSSGKQVVSAEDDSSAFAIGNRMQVDVSAFRRAQNNIAGGVSLLQIADGAVSRMSDILTRMKAIAIQANSGQAGTDERAVMDLEYQQLINELQRIATDTEFNGTSLLNGSTTTIGDINDMLGDNLLTGVQSVDFEDSFGNGAITISYDSSNNEMTMVNLETGDTQIVDVGSTAIASGSTQTVRFGAIGASVVLSSDFDKTADISETNTATVAGGTGGIDASTISLLNTVTINDSNAFDWGEVDDATISINPAVPANSSLSMNLNGTAFTATGVDLSTIGLKTATFNDGNGNSFQVNFTASAAFSGAETTSEMELKTLGTVVGANSSSINSADFGFQIGNGTSSSDSIDISIPSVTVSQLGLFATQVSSAADAQTALAALDGAVTTVNDARAEVGAAQSRLEFAGANLAVVIENTESARSSLLDLDVPAEVTKLTSQQALLEMGLNMLGRANSRVEDLLQLLR